MLAWILFLKASLLFIAIAALGAAIAALGFILTPCTPLALVGLPAGIALVLTGLGIFYEEEQKNRLSKTIDGIAKKLPTLPDLEERARRLEVERGQALKALFPSLGANLP